MVLGAAVGGLDGCEIHFAPAKKPLNRNIVCWYLQGRSIIPGFLLWCEMDFVHPQWSVASICFPST